MNIEPFDFYSLPLSSISKKILAANYESVVRGDQNKFALVDLVLENAVDPIAGTYVAITSDRGDPPYRYLPNYVGAFVGNEADIRPRLFSEDNLFNNPLLIPPGCNSKHYDKDKASKPSQRATNAGWIIVTLEFDCSEISQLDFLIQATDQPLSRLDKVLSESMREYRGYTAVFSGSKSVHFHFLVSTTHFKNCPSNETWVQRSENAAVKSHFMAKVHGIYWDRVWALFEQHIQPPLGPDPALNSYFQRRRMPYGRRVLIKPAPLLNLEIGTRICQIVIKEKHRQRAATGASYFLPETFTDRQPSAKYRAGPVATPLLGHDRIVTELQRLCKDQWRSEYPMPDHITADGSDYVIWFRNGLSDEHPSTIVKGDYSTLLMKGRDVPVGEFRLPMEMSANELIEHLSGVSDCFATKRPLPFTPKYPTKFAEVKAVEKLSWDERIKYKVEKKHPTVLTNDRQLAEDESRHRLRETIAEVRRPGRPYLIRAAEGSGKTTMHFDLLFEQMVYEAGWESRGDNPVQRFACIACRSKENATSKCEEYRKQTGENAVVIRSFWYYYEEACEEAAVQQISRYTFESMKPLAVLKKIKRSQPEVFDILERYRKNLWGPDSAYFHAASTVLFTTHAMILSWLLSHLTRIWHHPDFQYEDDDELSDDYDEIYFLLKKKFALAEVVIDEPEVDEFILILPKHLYDHIADQQSKYPDWSHRPRQEKMKIHRDACGEAMIDLSFDDYDAYMRIDLDGLTKVTKQFGKLPYGLDRIKSIYREHDGNEYYVGAKEWPITGSFRLGFLTTEVLVSDIISAIYAAVLGVNLYRLDVPDDPNIYPVSVPVVLDKRASKRGLQELAAEVLAADENNIIIVDGHKDRPERSLTFQGAKGRNGLNEKNIYVIPKFLSQEEYEKWNVISQWLHMPDLLLKHYADNIQQAVGRNSGYRTARTGQKAVCIICTREAWREFVKPSLAFAERLNAYQEAEKPWLIENAHAHSSSPASRML